jgi:serine/threonine-protein kinase
VRQVCHALGAAHERGIVHRDIKPENVFLTGDPAAPVAKVLDFGISKLAGDAAGLTKTGMVMGTPAYMAPEQARGDKVDHQADIYATGAILYRAVTGKRPFEEMDALATLTSVLTEEPPRPREIAPSVPDALEIVIQRAMAKEPADRYRSMAAFDADLAVFDTGLPAAGSSVTHDSAGTTFVKPVAASSGDATARTVLAAGPAANQTVARMAREAKMARPTIVAFSIIGWVLLTALAVEAIAAAIRWLGESGNLTPGEATLSVLGAVAATLTPGVLWIRYVLRKVWTSTPRAIELGFRLRRTVLAGAALYGFAALTVSLLEVLVRREAHGISWPGWALVEFVVALTAAAIAWSTSLFARR